MTTDYKPNPLARKIIRLLLVNRQLSVSADRLADMFGTTPTQVRQTLAPAVGRKIVERETNNLTGEQEYAAGRHIGEMEHLQPTGQEQIQRDEEAVDQEMAEAPHVSKEAPEVSQADTELVAITSTDMPPGSRIDLDELQLADVPAPTGRTAAVSRYDGHFREALESGRAITMPPSYVKAVSDAARSWARRHAPKHEVKSCGRLTGCHFGAIWITARKPGKREARA